MNNLVVVILPFTGDVSALVSEEVAKVFQVIIFVLKTGKKWENMKNLAEIAFFAVLITITSGHGWFFFIPCNPLHKQVWSLSQQTEGRIGRRD